MGLSELVKISNYYGNNEDYVLAGGGNTSFKDENYLYIKGSGTTLATITESGFVKMNRKRLAQMWEKEYSHDTAKREAQVLQDLMDARQDDEKRPSVETSLHDLFPQSYVVHTHPALVNGLTCAAEGERHSHEIFGDDVIWIPPTMPGYVLAADVKAKIDGQRAKGKTAEIILLANHGVFVAGDDEQEIKRLMDKVFASLAAKTKRQPDMTPVARDTGGAEALLKDKLNVQSVIYKCNNEILSFVKNGGEFKKVYSAFTPDHMVYYKHKAMFLDDSRDIDVALPSFTEKFGFAPKIVAIRNIGVFACDESEKAAQTAARLFNDTVKIAVYAESFGGGAFMPDWLIDFISGWEVESYRKSKS